jgi:hypothetical protein
MNIHRPILILTIALLVGAPLALAGAKGKQADQKEGMPIVLSDSVKMRGTVDAIDYDKRMVTLKGPQGDTITMKVNDDVVNFDQIQKGDDVVTEYYESVALGMRKSGQGRIKNQVEIAEMVPPGEKPGRFEMKTAEVAATVEAIDYDHRTVKLRGPEGDALTIKVDEHVKSLDKLKRGDKVVAKITEAFAISVLKP